MKTLKEKIEVMQAALDGKPIEFWSETKCQWMKTNPPAFQWADVDYRVQPQPPEKKLVAMQPEDYPPVFWVRRQNNPGARQVLCVSRFCGWLAFGGEIDDIGDETTIHVLAGIDVANPRPCEWSVDRRNWAPCTKEVDA